MKGKINQFKQAENFSHHAVEQKWSRLWEQSKLDVAQIEGQSHQQKFYNLMMFPYPSAEGLHVGNMYAFTGSDIYGRFKRMQGFNVFEPIGLDGFGIHSENYALKTGRHPADQAKIAEKNYYGQLHRIGAMFDWTRTVETYDPDYYKWTQWLFLEMFKHGLAYRAKAEVNWCPSDKTVLADEQVIDGRCERCGNLVEKKSLEQWFFRITAYAGKLLGNLNSLNWSSVIKTAQKTWIGKKEGINITYPVVDKIGKGFGEITCFTTRPDTNFGATFVVIAPEHPFITQLLKVIKSEEAVTITNYVNTAKKKSKDERIAEGRVKTGVFTGLFCVNQLNGYKMPLYVSDFVVMGVGTGAVVGVPGHDKRDFEFAKKMKLRVLRVVVGADKDTSDITKLNQVQEDEGHMINSDFLDGLDIHVATKKISDYLTHKGWGKPVTTYHLRDWLLSRQRYWGPPIPMIYCKECAAAGRSWFSTEEALSLADANSLNSSNRLMSNQTLNTVGNDSNDINNESNASKLRVPVLEKDQQAIFENKLKSQIDLAAGWYPVPEGELPVLLPYIPDYKPGDDGVAPLAKHKEFYETKCPGCGAKAVRETDVSDTFLDSSWYFLKYPSVGVVDTAQQLPWDPEITKHWLPVDMYTGGAEHSVLHLMYSRFITMALHDWGYLNFEEPFTQFFAHGLIVKDGAKMSKSKGNVVNPDEYLDKYGTDALRLYLMFMGPFSEGGDFRDSAMEGMSRWVGRVWRMALVSQNLKAESKDEIKMALNKLVGKVTDDMEKRRYNTAIASMMEFTNLVADAGALGQEELKIFTKLLAPFAPFIAEEIWQRIKSTTQVAEVVPTSRRDSPQRFSSVHLEPWPAFDPKAIKEEAATIIVQVNGKLRATIELPPSKSKIQNEVESLAKTKEQINKHLEGKSVRKVIFVPGKLLNFVVS